MASKKQVGLLLARAADAGVKAEWSDFVDLDNGQIDEKLAEFESLKKGEIVGNVDVVPIKELSFNDMRFGMCCKLVVKKTTLAKCISDRKWFASEVLSLYNSVTYAACVVKEKIPTSPHDIVTAE